MDTCTNCGETLRPGAKFCTTCGTRLNEHASSTAGWGTPPPAPDDDSQQTTVLNAVEPPAEPAEQTETPRISKTRYRSADAWTSAYGGDSAETHAGASAGDPASRFISALDDEVHSLPDEDDVVDSEVDPTSTWGTPAPAFSPPPPSNWSFTGGDEIESEVDSTWEAPSTWETPSTRAAVQSTPASPADDGGDSSDVDTAGFSEGGNDEVDYLSGDENIERSSDTLPQLAPDEARDKAIALADELRRTIRMMSSDGESDHGAAMMALTEVSLHVGDFSDVRGVVAEVKDNPRDIHTLGDLVGKVHRIEALLDEHTSLVDAIELTIKELNGN